MTSTSRLSTNYQNVLSTKIANAFGFDRITLQIDHARPSLPFAEIAKHCGDCKVQSLRGQPYWKCEIKLFQPSKRAVEILREATRKSGYRVKISSIEVTWDAIVGNPIDAEKFAYFVLKHLVVKYARNLVECIQGTTFYYEKRSGEGVKKPHVFVIYFDLKSKQATRWKGRNCCHFEHRYFGSEKIKSIGISSLDDVLQFDHLNFWKSSLDLVDLPSKKTIGLVLSIQGGELSDTAYINKANRLLKTAEVFGYFVMQNMKLLQPHFFSRYATPLDHIPLLEFERFANDI